MINYIDQTQCLNNKIGVDPKTGIQYQWIFNDNEQRYYLRFMLEGTHCQIKMPFLNKKNEEIPKVYDIIASWAIEEEIDRRNYVKIILSQTRK